jgi:hypothetical protein
MTHKTRPLFLKYIFPAVAGVVFLFAGCFPAAAQVKPPRPISLYAAQGLSFGAFSVGTGNGSVTISSTGSRSSMGSITLYGLGFPYVPAIFEVDANQGTLLYIINGPDATLTGSNGGTLTLVIGASTPASPFITSAVPPSRNQIYIGGTLQVGGSSPAGSYTGTFSVTIMLN